MTEKQTFSFPAQLQNQGLTVFYLFVKAKVVKFYKKYDSRKLSCLSIIAVLAKLKVTFVVCIDREKDKLKWIWFPINLDLASDKALL